MTLSRNRSNVQIHKIQFIYDVCQKKFMFSNHPPPPKKTELSQNEHEACQIMNIFNQLFIIMYPLTYF